MEWEYERCRISNVGGISAAYQLISPQCKWYQCMCWTKQSVVSGSRLAQFSKRLTFCGLISPKYLSLGVSHWLWFELSGNICVFKSFHTLLRARLKPMPGVLHGTNTERLSVIGSHWWRVCFGHSTLPWVGGCFTRLFSVTFFPWPVLFSFSLCSQTFAWTVCMAFYELPLMQELRPHWKAACSHQNRKGQICIWNTLNA